jgi:hypothetical protein
VYHAPKRLKSLRSEQKIGSKRLKSLLLYFLRGEKKAGNLYLFIMQAAGRGVALKLTKMSYLYTLIPTN